MTRNLSTNVNTDFDWTPRRRGDIYCSPRCGGGCTHAAFEKATKEADELCKRLGPGWVPGVWENLGWHYQANFGEKLEVHVHRDGSATQGGWVVTGYAAWIQTSPQFISGEHQDPVDAIKDACGMMQKIYDDFRNDVLGVMKALPEATDCGYPGGFEGWALSK